MAATSTPWPSGDGGGPAFAARISRGNGQAVLWLAGEQDITVRVVLADALSAALSAALRAPGGLLAVDLSGLAFMDLSGLRLLIAADARLRAEGRAPLAVRGAAGSVARLFEIAEATALLAGQGAGACPPAAPPLPGPGPAARADA
ncbi:MAG TPA: STAS domain-containing protein [Trebonia sp.]|nr:STAS domain-containing protein [Trebonia sp.]